MQPKTKLITALCFIVLMSVITGVSANQDNSSADLALMSINYSQAKISVGENVYFTIIIKNIGKKAIRDEIINLHWFADGKRFFEERLQHAYIAINDSFETYAVWRSIPLGEHTIKVILEAPNLNEEKKDNNELSKKFEVKQSPFITVKESYIKETSKNEYSFYVKIQSKISNLTAHYTITETSFGDETGNASLSLDENDSLITTIKKDYVSNKSELILIITNGTESYYFNKNLSSITKILIEPFCEGNNKTNFSNKETVSGIKRSEEGKMEEYTYTDFCQTEKILVEYLCEGPSAQTITFNCPNKCINGRCTEASELTEKLLVDEQRKISEPEKPQNFIQKIINWIKGLFS